MQSAAQDRGFALVLVIWVISLISLMVAGYSTLMRSEIKLASNALEAQRAELLADAGTELALLDIARTASIKGHQPKYTSGQPKLCTIADAGIVRLTISNEAGRVDLNAAGIPLLEALFSGLGFADRASALAALLYDYRDGDDDARVNGGEREHYSQAGLTWGPKNSDLTSVEELSQVAGFDAGLIERLTPFVTVNTGQAGIAADAAPAALLEILQKGSAGRVVSLSSFPELDRTLALPRIFFSPLRRNVFSVQSEARTSSGAHFVRQAIVRITQGPRNPIEVLGWRTQRNGERLPESASLVPCPN